MWFQGEQSSLLIRGSAHQLDLPDKSVQVIATSPPYFGQRRYKGDQDIIWPETRYQPMPNIDFEFVYPCDPDCPHEEWSAKLPPHHPGQVEQSKWKGAGSGITTDSGCFCVRCGAWKGALGGEPSVEMFIGHLILCMREWQRVLRDDGLIWINLGDGFAGSGGAHKAHHRGAGISNSARRGGASGKRQNGAIKPKDKYLVPHRLALAAQADGWYVRQENIWAKAVSLNPAYSGSALPDSTKDRPSTTHETIYLFAKSEQYFFDMESVKEPVAAASLARISQENFANQLGGPKDYGNGVNGSRSSRKAVENFAEIAEGGRHLRSVWLVNPTPSPIEHTAMWPEKLVAPMIRSSVSLYGCCSVCGAPYERVLKKGFADHDGESDTQYEETQTAGRLARLRQAARAKGEEYSNQTKTIDWRASCTCEAELERCVAMDPFSGSGTTGRVAIANNCRYIGVDISAIYQEEIAVQRTTDIQMTFQI